MRGEEDEDNLSPMPGLLLLAVVVLEMGRFGWVINQQTNQPSDQSENIESKLRFHLKPPLAGDRIWSSNSDSDDLPVDVMKEWREDVKDEGDRERSDSRKYLRAHLRG